MSTDTRTSKAGALFLLAGAGVYLCALIGYGLAIQPGGVSAIWPAGGFVLAMLILSDQRSWAAVVVGALVGGFLGDLRQGASAGIALAGAGANAIESLVAASVVTRFVGRRVALRTLREVMAVVVGAAVVSNAVTALVGALVIGLGTPEGFWAAWTVWWTGDGMGMLIVTPAILAWADVIRRRQWLPAPAAIEAATVLGAITVLGYATLFANPVPRSIAGHELYLVFPLLLWMAARFGPWGATTATLLLSAMVEWAAAHGAGPFGATGEPAIARVYAIYSYLGLASVSSLIPASILRERQHAESELRRSEQRFREMAEHIQESFFIVDLLKGQTLYISPTWSEIWGRPLAEGYDAKIWYESIHPDDRPAMAASQAEVARGVASTTVFRIVRPDGTMRWVRGRAFPVRNAAGAVTRLVGISEDVTAQHEMEEALHESYDRLDQTARLAGVGGWQLEIGTRRLRWADEVYRIHEIDPSVEPTLADAVQRYAPEARPVITAAIEAVIAHGTPFDLELPMVTATGRRIWVRVLGAADRQDGRATRVHGAFQDITARREADDLRRLQSAALEATADAIVITDRYGAIEWVNPAFTRLTGYSADESLGKNPRDLIRSGKQPATFYQSMWETILSGRSWQGEVINRRKDGGLYTEDMAITPITGASGAITHFVAIKTDITERLKLEAQLRQSQKVETVGQLAGGIAHDFNNLLTVINGVGELALADLGPAHPVHDDILEMVRAGERAAQLTRQLLAFSRQQIMQSTVINLNELVAGAEKLLRRLLDEDIELLVVPEPDLGRVMGDRGQLEQVLVNLVVNARDAMPGGGRLTIETRNVEIDASYPGQAIVAVPPGPYVQLIVVDTGSGMDDATKARIFDPFFTTKPAGRGTGLGLSTVYGIVKQSQGFVWVASEVGRGTRFCVDLPRVTDAGDPVRESASGHRPVTGTETVLVVDDAAEVRMLMKRLLEPAGYTVLTAATGVEALQALERPGERIRLVITDVVMPDMGGRELAGHIPRRPDPPRVLFMSGHPTDTVLRHGIAQAQVPFLEKPFTKTVLLSKVRDVLDA